MEILTLILLFCLLLNISQRVECYETKKEQFAPKVMFSASDATLQEIAILQETISATNALQFEDEKQRRKMEGESSTVSRRRLTLDSSMSMQSPDIIPFGGNFSTAAAVTLIDRNSSSSIIFYTTDGTIPDPQFSSNVTSGGTIGMTASGFLMAMTLGDGIHANSKVVQAKFHIMKGRVGKMLLVPFDTDEGFSGKVLLVDLNTTLYSKVRIHNVFTDFGNYYSNLGIGPFDTQGQLRSYDLSIKDASLKGFWGAVYLHYENVNYGFLVPNFNGIEYSGKVVRIDLDAFWTKNETQLSVCNEQDADWPACDISVLDLTKTDTHLRGFVGGFVHGNNVYLVPFQDGQSTGPGSHLVRFDGGMFLQSTVQFINVTSFNKVLGGYYGALTFNDAAFLIPYRTTTGPVGGIHSTLTVDGFKPVHSYVPRLEKGGGNLELLYHGLVTKVNLTTFEVVDVLDLADIYPDLRGFAGGFVAGKYGYLIPYKNIERQEGGFHGNFVKIDLETFSLVSFLDLAAFDPDLKGFVGGFSSGKYGYLVPYANGNLTAGCPGQMQQGKLVRVDLNDFSTDTMLVIDLPTIWRQQVPGQPMYSLCGYIHGFSIGDYGYILPHFNGIRQGKVVRVDLRDYADLATRQLSGQTTNIYLGHDGIQVCDFSMADKDFVGFAGGIAFAETPNGWVGTPWPS